MALEEVKGKAKEAVGSMTGSDDLRKEGQSQQNKVEEDKAAEARAETDKHESKAEGHEGAESKHQGS